MKEKKRSSIWWIIVIITALALAAGVIYADSKIFPKDSQSNQDELGSEELPNSNANNDNEDKDFIPTTEPKDNEKPSPEFEVGKAEKLKQTAWIPDWDYARGTESVYESPEQFHSVSPVWYGIDTKGNLVNRSITVGDPQLRLFTKERDILLIPSISSFDAEIMEKNLSGEALQNHISSILSEVEEHDYDGIDLDYEMIYLAQETGYINLIKALAEGLHKDDKILSVTVLSKWGDDVVYSGLKETRQLQRWDEIAQYADQVRIMTYDFTSNSDSEAGPIAPLQWMKSVLEYAVTKMDRDKIWLGVHLYGYDWGNGQTKAYTYSQVSELLGGIDQEPEFNETIGEGILEYNCTETISCIVYYQTPQGVDLRRALATEFGIAGVAYWRLGGEDNLITH